MHFHVGSTYSRSEVKHLSGLPKDAKGGDWDTGIVENNGEFFIFANVGTAGRTGHDYANEWVGKELRWFHKSASRLSWPSVISLLEPSATVHVFWRESNKGHFKYAGKGIKKFALDTQPVEVRWLFQLDDVDHDYYEGIEDDPAKYPEGSTKSIRVNVFERDRKARDECIRHHGSECCICGFSFARTYGELGIGFIHVHHLIQMADIAGEYLVDPKDDLRPVCPNCHAMLHRRRKALSIEELAQIVFKYRIAP